MPIKKAIKPKKKTNEDKTGKEIYASVKITKSEYEEIEKLRKEAAKKGIRLTIKEIMNKAFANGLKDAEKEIENAKKERKINKAEKQKRLR